MDTTQGNGRRRAREPRTVEELLLRERERALAGLDRSLNGLRAELVEAFERSPVARHPLLSCAAALVLGVVGAPLVLRGLGLALRPFGPAAELALKLAPGLARNRLWPLF